jgi:hypothetical protein
MFQVAKILPPRPSPARKEESGRLQRQPEQNLESMIVKN